MKPLNDIGRRLVAELVRAKQLRDKEERARAKSEKVNIVGAGGALTAAYEQLRNAAENSEEHLLLQNAIKRFYRQLFVVRDDKVIADSGNELIIELTLAGYVENDSITKRQIERITELSLQHYHAYLQLKHRRAARQEVMFGWVIDSLAVEVSAILRPRYEDVAFVDFSYEYLSAIIPATAVGLADDFGAALYISIYRALLKSDSAETRVSLLRRYGVDVMQLDTFIDYNKRIDELIESPKTDELYHIVDRQGAPLRIIRRMIADHSDIAQLLTKQDVFLDAFEKQVNHEYMSISRRINHAVVRSVVFLIITKFLIGIAIEVPYDIFANGHILWQPLIINLLFPPIYMVLLRLTNTLPSYANTTALVSRIDTMLYGEQTTLIKATVGRKKYGTVFSLFYGFCCILVFALVTWLLLLLNFSFVHIVIFFVFVSAASFLGFRLGHLIREIEIVRPNSNGVTTLRDFIYLPFVVAGQWMSDKYSKLNIVTIMLDMIIEMPLKTVLRLLRQWNAFIDDRKDYLS